MESRSRRGRHPRPGPPARNSLSAPALTETGDVYLANLDGLHDVAFIQGELETESRSEVTTEEWQALVAAIGEQDIGEQDIGEQDIGEQDIGEQDIGEHYDY